MDVPFNIPAAQGIKHGTLSQLAATLRARELGFDSNANVLIYKHPITNALIPLPEPGINGSDGTQWYTGNGVPVISGGENDGDLYLDVDTSDIYEFQGGVWTGPIANITGTDGATGARGTQWFFGIGDPNASAPVGSPMVADVYQDTVTGDVYQKTAEPNSWIWTANIKGADGTTGALLYRAVSTMSQLYDALTHPDELDIMIIAQLVESSPVVTLPVTSSKRVYSLHPEMLLFSYAGTQLWELQYPQSNATNDIIIDFHTAINADHERVTIRASGNYSKDPIYNEAPPHPSNGITDQGHAYTYLLRFQKVSATESTINEITIEGTATLVNAPTVPEDSPGAPSQEWMFNLVHVQNSLADNNIESGTILDSHGGARFIDWQNNAKQYIGYDKPAAVNRAINRFAYTSRETGGGTFEMNAYALDTSPGDTVYFREYVTNGDVYFREILDGYGDNYAIQKISQGNVFQNILIYDGEGVGILSDLAGWDLGVTGSAVVFNQAAYTILSDSDHDTLDLLYNCYRGNYLFPTGHQFSRSGVLAVRETFNEVTGATRKYISSSSGAIGGFILWKELPAKDMLSWIYIWSTDTVGPPVSKTIIANTVDFNTTTTISMSATDFYETWFGTSDIATFVADLMSTGGVLILSNADETGEYCSFDVSIASTGASIVTFTCTYRAGSVVTFPVNARLIVKIIPTV